MLNFNSLVTEAQYSQRRDKLISSQIKSFEFDWGQMGLKKVVIFKLPPTCSVVIEDDTGMVKDGVDTRSFLAHTLMTPLSFSLSLFKVLKFPKMNLI